MSRSQVLARMSSSQFFGISCHGDQKSGWAVCIRVVICTNVIYILVLDLMPEIVRDQIDCAGQSIQSNEILNRLIISLNQIKCYFDKLQKHLLCISYNLTLLRRDGLCH